MFQSDDDILDTSRLDLSGDFDKQVSELLQRVRLSRQQVEELRMLYVDLELTIHTRWPVPRNQLHMLGLSTREITHASQKKSWSLQLSNFLSTSRIQMILPPVTDLQMCVEPYLIDHWNTAFDESHNLVSFNNDSFYNLLGGFFEFYNEFDFENFVICPYLGYPVSKEIFKHENDIPPVYGLYKINLRHEKCLPLRMDKRMCVQDPFEHCRNCAVAVFPKLANMFNTLFLHTTKMFKEVPRERFLEEMLRTQPELESVVAPPTNRRPYQYRVVKPPKIFQRKKKTKGLLKAIQECRINGLF